MSKGKKRISRIKTSLTPKQAVILWMEEAHKHGDFFSYGRWLREQPPGSYPLMYIPDQVEAAIRKENKGQPVETVIRAVRQGVRDTIFLFMLQMGIKPKVREEAKPHSLYSLMLVEE